MKTIPNLLTLSNLFFGCIAIVFILQTGETLVMQNEEGTWLAQLPEKIWWGSACIGIAAVIDFLDGFVARWLNAESSLGKQLDSLADTVSFGVAPSMILYQLLRISYIQEESALDTTLLALIPAFVFACAGAYRLGRFNLETVSSTGFRGVPIPAAGLVVASLPLILVYNYYNINEVLLNKWFLYGIILMLSWLMVSTLPMLAFKFKSAGAKQNLPVIILLVFSLIAFILLKWLAVPVIFILYIVLSLVYKNKNYDLHRPG
ncbi:MAG TPA: phosphatidylcholine/phosphatidylserine synthase [Flavitalea sp.]|nr:phosphatidylcholine/phosphatidylserine synthase [Flavitalea sp.]